MANTPPSYLPEAIPTAIGWAHPLTGEQLDVTTGLETPVGYYNANCKGLSFLDPNSGRVASIAVSTPGSGYAAAPTVGFTGGGGSGAAATAVLGTGGAARAVASVTITNPGTGYTTPPAVTFTAPPAIVSATGTAVLTTFTVTSVTITSQGSGYASVPTVTFTGDGTGAAGTAVLGTGADIDKVVSVTMTNAGSGYTVAPTVGFTGGAGILAAATTTLTSAYIQSLCNFIVSGKKVSFSVFLQGGHSDIETISFNPNDTGPLVPLGPGQLRFEYTYVTGVYNPTITINFTGASGRAQIVIAVATVTVA